MPLFHMGDMLHHAHSNRYAIDAPRISDLDSLLGAVSAAEHARSPLILVLENTAGDPRRLELLAAAAVRAAQGTEIPVAIQASPVSTPDAAARAVNLGCNALALPPGDTGDPALAREVMARARDCGVAVEAGLSGRPDPEQAQRFLADTRVHCLALDGPAPDPDHLEELNGRLALPLALGSDTGMDDAMLRHAVASGVSKIGLSGGAEQPVEEQVALWGSAGRAPEVLAQCRPQRTVEHVILYNLEGLDAAGTRAMMDEGRRVLGAIPGVQRVFTGDAVQPDAAYRHCWVVRFSDAAVIDSYREHPDHKAFADRRFRPFAGGRVSIDYTDTSV